jgi:hypothetical protein
MTDTRPTVEFKRTDLGWLVTDGPGLEEVTTSIPTMARTQDPQTGQWRVSDGYARQVAAALRSRGFTVKGI